jgi:hypothetical protein
VPGRPRRDLAGLEDNPSWSAYYLWKDGEIVLDHAARCPKTLAALAQAPQVWAKGRSPSVLFSQLRPRAWIPPHTGLTNTRLICHLPLIVRRMRLRVGSDARVPVEGKAWCSTTRWSTKPGIEATMSRDPALRDLASGLTEEERALVADVRSDDAYSGEKPAWSI